MVELILDIPLTPGGFYEVYAEGVPATDASTTAPGTKTAFRLAAPDKASPFQERQFTDREKLLYFEDFIWDGADFVEAPNGDLARVSGTANVGKAILRGATTNGLPWDPSWGVDAEEYVDAPAVAVGTMRGALSSQALKDPRVSRVRVTAAPDSDGNAIVTIAPELVSGESVQPATLKVRSG